MMTESHPVLSNKVNDNLEYKAYDILVTLISAFFHLIDIFTGVILFIKYFQSGLSSWSWTTLFFVLFPCALVEALSLTWHILDSNYKSWHWIVHISCSGILERCFNVILMGVNTIGSKDNNTAQKLSAAYADLNLLLIIGIFLGTVPQLVVQLTAILTINEHHFFIGLSISTSMISISLSLLAYFGSEKHGNGSTRSWTQLALQCLWHLSMLSARICSLALLLLCFKLWFLLFISVHWLSMLLWILYQETYLNHSDIEKCCYNAIAAAIFCFSFLNLKYEKSRWKIVCFYSLTILENLTCLTVYLMWFSETIPHLGLYAFVVVVGGTAIGLSSMLAYFQFYHSSGPFSICDSLETNSKPHLPMMPVRTLKCMAPSVLSQYVKGVNNDNSQSNSDMVRSASKLTLSDSKLDMLTDSVVIIEETDTGSPSIDGWLKQSANIQQAKQNCELYESTSSVLSAHDYENLAAVNIARGGGLRSWRGYSDIETWLHDDSVVHEATASTTSTSQYYPDSIADECVECKLSTDPVGMFAPSSLGTILEEAESSCSERSPTRPRGACNLVATIDQIRITTPVHEERTSRVRRKFSLIREKFESRRDGPEAPPPAPWCPGPVREETVSPRWISVREMRDFFLKQVLSTPKLGTRRYKVGAI